MNLTIAVATMRDEPFPGYVKSIMDFAETSPSLTVRYNTHADNLGIVRSYQWLYERSEGDVIGYFHDDLEVYEPWDRRVLAEFADPKTAIVGFGGALGHGTDDLYKTPFRIPQLIRHGYRSNDRNAEIHGERFTGARNAVFCDGYALCIRREFLDRIDGWKQLIGHVDFIGYDMAICAMARRYGYKIRVVGIDSIHYGGGTSVGQNADRQEEYNNAHRWFYEEFRDVMPAWVKP